jgi:predicted nucleic acid-binding protein
MINEKVILDTSAVVTYFEDEDGKDIVEELLSSSASGSSRLLLPFSAAIEFYYINFNNIGEEIANQRFALLMSLPLEVIKNIDEPYMIEAGRLKASYPISFADSLIAAYAFREDAPLVHKDPEYMELKEEIKLITLPFKKNMEKK